MLVITIHLLTMVAKTEAEEEVGTLAIAQKRGYSSNYTTRNDFTMNKPHDEYIQIITTTQETIIIMSKSLSQDYANTTKTDIRSAKKKCW